MIESFIFVIFWNVYMGGKKHNKFPDGSVMVSDQTGLKFHGHKVIPAQLQTRDHRKGKILEWRRGLGFCLSLAGGLV